MIRSIHIQPVLNGFVVNVGCQTVVFNTMDGLAAALRAYSENPKLVEDQYFKEAVNRDLVPSMAAPAADPLACAETRSGVTWHPINTGPVPVAQSGCGVSDPIQQVVAQVAAGG